MTNAEIVAQLKRHEGLRLEVYEDSEGVLTVGYGHALHVGSRISKGVANIPDEMRMWFIRPDLPSMLIQLSVRII